MAPVSQPKYETLLAHAEHLASVLDNLSYDTGLPVVDADEARKATQDYYAWAKENT